MPRAALPIDERDLELSDPSLWPFQTVSSVADIYIARGAAIGYLAARRQFAERLKTAPLQTSIRTGALTPSGWPLRHVRTVMTLRHDVDPATPREDVKEWLHQVHDALLRTIPSRRSTSLYVTLRLFPAGYTGSPYAWTNPWW